MVEIVWYKITDAQKYQTQNFGLNSIKKYINNSAKLRKSLEFIIELIFFKYCNKIFSPF